MGLAFYAIVEHPFRLRLRLMVQIGVAEDNHIEGVQGGLNMRVIGVQKGCGLPATAHRLNPEEIRHGSLFSTGALFPMCQYTPQAGSVKFLTSL